MNKRLRPALIAVASIGLTSGYVYAPEGLAAQQAVAEPAAERTETGDSRSMLWKAEGENGTVYLLGSIHLLTPDVYPLDPAIENAFTDADRVVFEVHMDSITQRAPEMLALGTYTDGRTLETELSPETYALARAALPEYGLSAEQVALFEPWLLALTLSSIEWQKAGLQAEYGLDMYFTGKAKEAGKALGALETAEFQLNLFDRLDPAEQETFLRSTLDQLDKTAQMMDEATAAWQAGDTRRIDELMNESLGEYPSIYAKLLTERNHNWMPRIETFLRGSEDVLVVVGAAHLVGEDGVVTLLKNRGYEVEQL